MCRLLFFKDSAITLQTSTWTDHINQKEMLYEIKFDIDPLFGLKICLTVDRAIQLFLTSCQEYEDLDKVNFRCLDSSFDQEFIEKGRFSCNPPPLLLNLFDAATPIIQTDGGGGGKIQRRNALSNPKQKDDGDNRADLIQNPDKNKDWILSLDEDYKKVFPRPIWSENPTLQISTWIDHIDQKDILY